MNKTKFFSAFFIILASVLYIGCGEDSTTNNGGGPGGTPPTINMKVGSFYVFNIDSISANGNIQPTTLKTSNTFVSQGTFFNQPNAFEIASETKDTATNITLGTSTFYVRYDGGKFYQYGVLQLISPSIPPTWDLVADFTVPQGTSFDIALGVPITIGPATAIANITGRIAADTTFKTHGYGQRDVNCFRSHIVADILVSNFSIGKVYVDYYIGDSDPVTNPAGLVRVRLNPVNLPVYQAAGVDQKIQNFIIP